MTLWLSMTAMSALAALWLTHPLWRRSRSAALSRRTANVLAYASRSEELEAEVVAGVLPAEEAKPAQQELEARLVEDATAIAPTPAIETPRSAVLAMVVAVLLPLAAGVWYWQAGSWRAAQQIAAGPDAAPGNAEIEQMVERLAARLAANPSDAEGFAMLGRSYFVMGRHADAAKAYAQANTLAKNGNAEWLVAEGEALAMSRERDLLGRPEQLFEAALVLAPTYGKALWYGSLADAQAGRFERAGTRLEALLAQDLPEDLKTLVLSRIEEMRGMATNAPAAVGLPSSPVADAAQSGGLEVAVSLAPALAARVPAAATLFVFAKAAQGPPMPLAVQKLAGAKLPMTVRLDDTMAMAPALKLSQFERYVVTARLSGNGQAIAASGDIEGSAEASRGSQKPVLIRIDRVVP